MITSDSMDGRMLDPSHPIGHSVEMPYLRALSARGTNFVSSYTHSPVCGPSRASALTSRFVHDTGTWNNYQELVIDVTGALDTRCIAHYGKAQCTEWAADYPSGSGILFDAFADAGYETAIFGKVDIGANVPARYSDGDDQVDHTGPEMRTVPRGAGLVRNSMDWGGWSDPIETNDNGYHIDAKTTNQTLTWMRARSANVSETRPFFAYTGLNIPHPDFITGPKWLARVNRSTVTPPWAPDDPSLLHPYDWHMSVSKGCTEPTTTDTMLRIKTTYLAMCAQADDFHGAVLNELHALGWENNTIVVFWSDHGELAFDARQVLKDSFREGSARVPLIFAGPGVAAGRTVTAPASLLDLWPTLADLTGIAPPTGARGLSLASALAPGLTPGARAENFVVGEFFAENADTGSFFIVQGVWKLITYGHSFPWFQNYTAQLYNLTADPGEQINRATQHIDVVAALDALLISALDASYQDIDALAMRNDQLIFRSYLTAGKNLRQVRAGFAGTYKNFSDTDWERVLLWNQTEPSRM